MTTDGVDTPVMYTSLPKWCAHRPALPKVLAALTDWSTEAWYRVLHDTVLFDAQSEGVLLRLQRQRVLAQWTLPNIQEAEEVLETRGLWEQAEDRRLDTSDVRVTPRRSSSGRFFRHLMDIASIGYPHIGLLENELRETFESPPTWRCAYFAADVGFRAQARTALQKEAGVLCTLYEPWSLCAPFVQRGVW